MKPVPLSGADYKPDCKVPPTSCQIETYSGCLCGDSACQSLLLASALQCICISQARELSEGGSWLQQTRSAHTQRVTLRLSIQATARLMCSQQYSWLQQLFRLAMKRLDATNTAESADKKRGMPKAADSVDELSAPADKYTMHSAPMHVQRMLSAERATARTFREQDQIPALRHDGEQRPSCWRPNVFRQRDMLLRTPFY